MFSLLTLNKYMPAKQMLFKVKIYTGNMNRDRVE